MPFLGPCTRSRLVGSLVLLVGFVSWWLCLGQDVSYLHHQAWTTAEGLPQNSVHRLLQTRDGFLWIATEGGLARFDGNGFLTFRHNNEPGFLSDDTCCLAQDGAGDLWIGTADGLMRYRRGEFTRFAESSGLPSGTILALLAENDGTLLVATSGGLAAGQEGRFHPVAAGVSQISGLYPAEGGGAWLVGDANAVLRWNGTAGVLAPAPDHLRGLLGLASARDGTKWMYSAQTVQADYRGARREWHAGAELPGVRVESLSVDHEGTAWVGTSSGLVLLRRDSPAAMPIPALRGDAVLETLEDREGNHWIGGETTGLHLLRSLKFRSEPALADTSLTGVVQASDGAMWVGTREDGLRRIRGGMAETPVPSRALSSPVILTLAPGADGGVWAGTPDGLNRIEANGQVRILTSADGLPDDYIRALTAGDGGSVWVGTRRGLAHVHGSRIEILTKADGLGGDLVGSLLAVKPGGPGVLWIGTSGGLSLLRQDGSIRTYGTGDGLPGAIVSAMAQDDAGTLWVATKGGGLSWFDRVRFHRIESPVFDGEIQAILPDGQGFLWLRRARGIVRVALADLERCTRADAVCSPSIATYGLADGLPSEEMVAGGSPAGWRTDAGELWLPTRRGLAITDPVHMPSRPVPPPVVIERFLVDDTAVSPELDPVELAYGHSRFTLDYAGLSYAVPSEIRYRFILEGFDREWTEARGRRSATYTNLPPGRYRFRVQAANNDGVWNRTGAELRFRIIPPFYRRWWFVLLVLFALVGVGVLIYRLRLRRLRRQFDAVLQERNRMAREIHDTLAQDFVGVSIQLDIVAQMLGQEHVEAAAKQVRETRKLVQNGLAEARQSIWELRANVTHDSLPARLTRAAERYTSPDLPIRLKVGGIFRKLDSRLEDEVLRIAQEALSNIQRHSGAGEAAIELRYERDMLVLVVEDNGRGFPSDEASIPDGHFGIRGMRERAATIDASLDLDSKLGIGTKLSLAVPLAKGK